MSKLKETRLKASITQKALAETVGMNLGTLRHYEQNSKNFDHAKMETILKTCIALNCKLEDVVESPQLIDLLKEYELKK